PLLPPSLPPPLLPSFPPALPSRYILPLSCLSPAQEALLALLGSVMRFLRLAREVAGRERKMLTKRYLEVVVRETAEIHRLFVKQVHAFRVLVDGVPEGEELSVRLAATHHLPDPPPPRPSTPPSSTPSLPPSVKEEGEAVGGKVDREIPGVHVPPRLGQAPHPCDEPPRAQEREKRRPRSPQQRPGASQEREGQHAPVNHRLRRPEEPYYPMVESTHPPAPVTRPLAPGPTLPCKLPSSRPIQEEPRAWHAAKSGSGRPLSFLPLPDSRSHPPPSSVPLPSASSFRPSPTPQLPSSLPLHPGTSSSLPSHLPPHRNVDAHGGKEGVGGRDTASEGSFETLDEHMQRLRVSWRKTAPSN
ncbi:hypothetical protein Naga_100662g1, partial [Nannochloropsis gaditana]